MADSWYLLSGFGDEISTDIAFMMDGLFQAGVRNVDFRSTANVSVVDLEDWQIDKINRELSNRKFRITCVSSPVGMISIAEPFEVDLVRLEKAIKAAKVFKTRFISVCSYYPPEGKDPMDLREEVIKRMMEMAQIAQKNDIVLLHENYPRTYGDNAQRCLDVLQTVNNPNLRAVFDFGNFVMAGEDPWTAWHALKPFVRYFHVKDCSAEAAEVVPPGFGDGVIQFILKDFKDGGGKAILAIEPQMEESSQYKQYSAPDRFKICADSLREILKRIG
jgi:3-dehydroshikimate dehydratase